MQDSKELNIRLGKRSFLKSALQIPVQLAPKTFQIHPDLAVLIEAWPSLPHNLRHAILAIVNSAE